MGLLKTMKNFKLMLLIGVAALVFSSGTSAGHLLDRYTPRVGDLNADGRADIFLQYRPDVTSVDVDGISVPILLSRSTVKEFVLQQNTSGGFDSVSSLTASQRAAAGSWSASQIPLLRGDYNADGRLDVYVKGTQSGIAGAQDSIVFAPLDDGSPPLGVTSIDSNRTMFIRDAAGWINNPRYFESGLYSQIEVGFFEVAYFSCDGYFYTAFADDPDLSSNYAGCEFLGYDYIYGPVNVIRFDPTGFSSTALDVLSHIAPYIQSNGRFNIPASEASILRQQATSILGVPIFAQTTVDVPAPGDFEGDYEWLKDMVRVNPWLLLALLVTTIPGDTVQEFFLWRVMGEVETAKTLGRVSQGKPPFQLDNPSGFGEKQFWQTLDDARTFMRKSRRAGMIETLSIIEVEVSLTTLDLCPTFQLSDGNRFPPRSCGPQALPSLNFDALLNGIKVRDVLLRGAAF